MIQHPNRVCAGRRAHPDSPAWQDRCRRQASRLATAIVLWFAACQTPPPPRPPQFTVPTTVAARVTLAPLPRDPEAELDQLRPIRTHAARLRVAYLELQLNRPAAAIDAAAEVLFGPDKPSSNDESFARYLRGLAYEQLGEPARGSYDFERANALAFDSGLLQLLRARQPAPADGGSDLADVDLVIANRAAWNARGSNRRNLDPMGRVTRLTIHHSAMPLRDSRPAACATQIQAIQRDHMQTRGYGDIGYHFLIDPSGRIWQGRDVRYQGAHASGDNNVGNLGICLLGNFLRGREGHKPTEAQVAAMQRLVVQLLQRYRLAPEAIYCHSHFKNTACPGPLMEPLVTRMVRDLQRHGGQRLADAAAGK